MGKPKRGTLVEEIEIATQKRLVGVTVGLYDEKNPTRGRYTLLKNDIPIRVIEVGITNNGLAPIDFDSPVIVDACVLKLVFELISGANRFDGSIHLDDEEIALEGKWPRLK